MEVIGSSAGGVAAFRTGRPTAPGCPAANCTHGRTNVHLGGETLLGGARLSTETETESLNTETSCLRHREALERGCEPPSSASSTYGKGLGEHLWKTGCCFPYSSSHTLRLDQEWRLLRRNNLAASRKQKPDNSDEIGLGPKKKIIFFRFWVPTWTGHSTRDISWGL